MTKPGPLPKQLIDTTWTKELAYVVGFFAADGCLSSDGLLVDFTSKDKEILEKIKHILNVSYVIGTKKRGGGNEKIYYRLQFKNRIFYDWLLSLGFMPRKSLRLGALAIPDEFYFDFVRGVFDGDGNLYGCWDSRWRHSYMFSIRLVSASKPFVLWLQERIHGLAHIKGAILNQGNKRVYALQYAKTESITLIQRMYYDTKAPHLARKKTKVVSVLVEANEARVAKLVNAYA